MTQREREDLWIYGWGIVVGLVGSIPVWIVVQLWMTR